jgi:HlyD family secretion protein
MLRLIFVPVLALAAIGVLWWSQWTGGPFFVSGFIEADDIRVGSRVGGRVRSVNVKEGQEVRQGEALIELEPFDLREQLARADSELAARKAVLERLEAGFRAEETGQARAQRDQARATLDRLVAGPRPLEIQIKQDRLQEARARLDDARKDYERVVRLFEGGQASDEEVNDATRALEVAQAGFAAARDELALAQEGTRAERIAEARAALAEAQEALALREAGYRKEEIDEARARASAAEADVAAIKERIEELTIRAPLDGVIEAIELEPGDLIAANAPVLTVILPDTLHVRAYVPENRLNLRVDQAVKIGVDAFGNRRFAGHIVFIARQAEFTPSNVQTPEERSKQVFRIKVQIDEGLDVLRAGMAADVYLEPVE